MTGIDGPRIKPSFPQPDDAAAESSAAAALEDEEDGTQDEEGDVRSGESDLEATTDDPPALSMPGARSDPEEVPTKEESRAGTEEPLSSFKTAPSRTILSASPEDIPAPSTTGSGASGRQLTKRATSRSSYVTAASELSDMTETQPDAMDDSETPTPTAESVGLQLGSTHRKGNENDVIDPRTSTGNQSSSNERAPDSSQVSGQNTSTTSLLRSQHQVDHANMSTGDQLPGSSIPVAAEGTSAKNKTDITTSVVSQPDMVGRRASGHLLGRVRFDTPDIRARKVEYQVRARLAQAGRKRLPRSLTRGRLQDGEIVKMEKMLVRVDISSGPEQPEDDFNEKDHQRVETRMTEKWREYEMVCRESGNDNAVLALQMYKSRVIPASNDSKVKKHWKHEILLDRAKVKVNLYSSLDKTVVLWLPKGRRTLVYFLRTRSGTSAVEWYHLIRQVLGHHRAQTLQVNVPDLSVSIRIQNPFDRLEKSQDVIKAADGDEEAIMRAVQESQGVADNIVGQCLTMLSNSGEWGDLLEAWASNDHVGLAWKRYDRLEWIHGVNEQRMYGTIAMQKTHELELRPKQHYPLKVKTRKGNILTEPPPVEGFLIRLTSQKGVDQKLGKLFFKRLYFTTQNQFLLFLKPAKAAPPPPPKMPMQGDSKIPTAKQIADKVPLVYAVNPYPMADNTVAWLAPDNASGENSRRNDLDASDEADRNVQAMKNCDGFINLCDVAKVRKVHRGATPADDQVDEGSEVDFDVEVPDSNHDDGKTTEMDDERTFELVLNNGLIIRLQAFSKATKKEWMRRLRDLIKYWTHRTRADMDLFKLVRQQNLQALNIDERAEAYMGQFAGKWEVTKSFASPELYHMCGISSCRTIHNSGMLFRKPRKHSTFTKCYVVLCHGSLLIFRDTLRTTSGKREMHIHHDRIASIDLADCYLYSGLITENDLLSQNQTFDSNAPGSHALPRIFLDDSWTSTDEDAMTCFVIWHSQRKGWFKQDIDDIKDGDKNKGEKGTKKQKLKRVNQLGVKGRSIVFKARSRAERDHWVLGISTEIERLSRGDDVRVVEGGK